MRHTIYAAVLLVALAAPVRAQEACSQYRLTPAIGSWAQYTSNRGGQDVTTRIAVVGQERRNGKDAIWFESSMESPRGRMVSEMLVPSYPFEPGSVIEAVMMRGDPPAMKGPAGMMAMMRGGRGEASNCPSGLGATFAVDRAPCLRSMFFSLSLSACFSTFAIARVNAMYMSALASFAVNV